MDTCTRCDSDGVVVTEGDESFCAGCAAARDWQELIKLVQDAQVAEPVAGGQRVARSA
jgi:hypothetical protein